MTVIFLLILMYVCYYSLFVFLLKSCFSLAKLRILSTTVPINSHVHLVSFASGYLYV